MDNNDMPTVAHHEKREAEDVPAQAATAAVAPDAKRHCSASPAINSSCEMMATTIADAGLPRRRTPRELQMHVHLTPQEQELFDFLLDVEKQYACACVLRVAGGWVRDKLLGRDSDDVDIVLDCMKGKAFADLINTYETDHGHKPHTVGVIKANPEQSKHLETATMQLGAIGWVDFVNLRAETYSEDHRIPEIEFGTPLQDAERRDFTINSLFYNIAEKRVEDFTNRGIDDLRNNILRTPLEPRVTFLDDPLRVLRAVRFASRFDLELDPSLRAAIELDEVKDALVKKVSRERVGKELVAMLVGSAAHPERALRLIHDLSLSGAIFLPRLAQPIYDSTAEIVAAANVELPQATQLWERGYACAAQMYALVQNAHRTADEQQQQTLKLQVLASFLLPLRAFCVMEKKRIVPLPTLVLRDSLKLRMRDADDVGNVILKHVDALRAFVENDAFDRVAVALLLRDLKLLWLICRDVALVEQLVDLPITQQAAVHKKYAAFTANVATHGLDGVWDLKPLLNGNELVKELGVTPGPNLKLLLHDVLVWQLQDPTRTRDACLAHFRTVVVA